jgi:phosphoglycolate phosphatase
MEKTGLIFDVDGTLWDSTIPVAESWTEELHCLGKSGVITPQDFKKVMGLPMNLLADGIFPQYPKEEREFLAKNCIEFEVQYLQKHPGTLYPRVKETLRTLAERYPLYIISNCQIGYIEALISGTGLDGLIKRHLCWGDNHLLKGENIRLLVREEGLEKGLYLGDTASDEAETHKAGLPFVYASYGFGKAIKPEATITSFDELPMTLQKVLK